MGEGLEQQRRNARSPGRTPVVALHLRPDPLDQQVVLDTGRAGGHAGHAAQAAVEVGDHLSASTLPSARPWPASTIRPRGESASLAHSAYVGHVSRQNPQWTQRSITDCSGGRCESNAATQIPPTNTPGLQVPVGSKRALTRRISSTAGPGPGRAPGIEPCVDGLRGVQQHPAARRRGGRPEPRDRLRLDRDEAMAEHPGHDPAARRLAARRTSAS